MKTFLFSILIALSAATLFNNRCSAQEKIYYGDCQNGFGVIITADKTTIYGNFQNGLLNGYALVVMPDGTLYAGFFKENFCWGKGIMLYPQGYVYIGDFEKNMQQGKGTMFVINTQIVDGTWNNNQPAQVNKIETKNQNSSCILGNCEAGPGHSFKDAMSLACFTQDMIFERKSKEYQYFGPRSGEGFMAIMSKEGVYVGMGKDRMPHGIGGRTDSKGKVEYGNWFTLSVGDTKATFCAEENKPIPIELILKQKFELPLSINVDDIKLSSDGKRAIITSNKKDFLYYDAEKKSVKNLAIDTDFLNIAISSNGKYGAYCSNGKIKLFDLDQGKEIFTTDYNLNNSTSFQFSPDDQYLYASNMIYFYPLYLGENAMVIGVNEKKVLKEYASTNYANKGYTLYGPASIFYKFIPVTSITKNNIGFSYSAPNICAHSLISNDTIKVFSGWYDKTTTKLSDTGDGTIMYFTTTLYGDHIALLRGDNIDILNIHQDKGEKGLEISFEPDFNFTDLTATYIENETKEDQLYSIPGINFMNFIGDNNGLIVFGGNALSLVDLRVKNPKHPNFSQKRKAGVYTLLVYNMLNIYPITNSNSFSFRTKENLVYVYDVNFK